MISQIYYLTLQFALGCPGGGKTVPSFSIFASTCTDAVVQSGGMPLRSALAALRPTPSGSMKRVDRRVESERLLGYFLSSVPVILMA